jgi:hypothetical protein
MKVKIWSLLETLFKTSAGWFVERGNDERGEGGEG